VKARDACLLKLEGVSKAYRGSSNKAVDNLSLEVAPGEIFGFSDLTAQAKLPRLR